MVVELQQYKNLKYLLHIEKCMIAMIFTVFEIK